MVKSEWLSRLEAIWPIVESINAVVARFSSGVIGNRYSRLKFVHPADDFSFARSCRNSIRFLLAIPRRQRATRFRRRACCAYSADLCTVMHEFESANHFILFDVPIRKQHFRENLQQLLSQ